MWTTVLVLAVALNFEPTRIGLVPLLLVRERPLIQLLAFLVGSLTMALGFGLLVLFVLHRSPLGLSSADGGRVQIIVGAAAMLAATVMALYFHFRRPSAPASEKSGPAARPDKLSAFMSAVLRRSGSPWLAGLVGIGAGLPSVDYLAVLLVITTSQASPAERLAALLTFLLIGGLPVMAPLIGYLISPARTLELLDRFSTWVRSRSQLEYAALLFVVGILLIGLGFTHL